MTLEGIFPIKSRTKCIHSLLNLRFWASTTSVEPSSFFSIFGVCLLQVNNFGRRAGRPPPSRGNEIELSRQLSWYGPSYIVPVVADVTVVVDGVMTSTVVAVVVLSTVLWLKLLL